MIAFASLLIDPAEQAGIAIPPIAGSDNEFDYNPEEYPHWHIYVRMQCGRTMPSPTSHWDNAKLIATLTQDELRTITMQQLLDKGLQ